jgi:hypothetical protein
VSFTPLSNNPLARPPPTSITDQHLLLSTVPLSIHFLFTSAMALELWACGFNAHNQLRNMDEPADIAFPSDITTPKLLATAKTSLSPLHIGWSCLVCRYILPFPQSFAAIDRLQLKRMERHAGRVNSVLMRRKYLICMLGQPIQ